jgi:hypothetical protein
MYTLTVFLGCVWIFRNLAFFLSSHLLCDAFWILILRIQVTITGQTTTRFNTSPTEESFRGQHPLLLQVQDSLEHIMEEKEATASSSASASLQFHENRGRNVLLSCGNTLARRSHSYNQGTSSRVLGSVRRQNLEYRYSKRYGIRGSRHTVPVHCTTCGNRKT